MSLLEEAIQTAVTAHRGQKDRAGEPYILHPLRVMCRMRTEEEKIVAILHDVVEDSEWTLGQLRERGFAQEVVSAVDALTRREGEEYDAFVARACANPLARRIKLADLEDNMDLRRNRSLSDKDLERFNRYLRAWYSVTNQKT